MNASPLTIGLMEKETLTRKALVALINNEFENCKVLFDAANGEELKQKLNSGLNPSILILELETPIRKALRTLAWLKENYPAIPVIILNNIIPDLVLINILGSGVRSFLKKAVRPSELKKAIAEVNEGRHFFNDLVFRQILKALQESNGAASAKAKVKLSEKELWFLELSSSELTYKEIADKMGLKEKYIDKIRAKLFEDLGLKNRTGLAITAIRNGIITLEQATVAVA
jgi:DNA-binding NarL/FixJ family response regulator